MNNGQNDITEDSAWYRQPTVWIVLGVLAFTMVSSFILLILAATNPPDVIERNATPVEAPTDMQGND